MAHANRKLTMELGLFGFFRSQYDQMDSRLRGSIYRYLQKWCGYDYG